MTNPEPTRPATDERIALIKARDSGLSMDDEEALFARIAQDAEIIKAREAAFDSAQEGLKSARKQEGEMRETIKAQAEKLAIADRVLDEAEARIRERDAEIERLTAEAVSVGHAEDRAMKAGAQLAQARKDNEQLREALKNIEALSEGWDEDGSTGPISPLSWESVARMALDYSRAALAAPSQPGYDANGSPVE